MRAFVAAVVQILALAAAASPLSGERELCLQHVRAKERPRLEQVLGPFADLPLYRAEVEIDPRTRVVSGRLSLDWKVEGRPLTALPLRVVPNVFAPGRVALSEVKVNGEPALLEENELGLFSVRPVSAVAVGATARVEVRFKARVPTAPAQQAGLLGAMQTAPAEAGDHGTFLARPRFISLVGILPMVPPLDARGEVVPGPSGLGDLALYAPANFVVAVKVPRTWQVHATGVALGELPEKDGRMRHAFAAGAVRDFPLFASQGYATLRAKVGEVEVESVHDQAHAEAGAKVLEHAREVLQAYQARLGPIPHAVLRLVEVPLLGGASGMEFSGLVAIDSSLYRGAQGPAAMLGLPPRFEALLGGALGQLDQVVGQSLELTVAHELAHQYFPGIVGSDPVLAPVVDESLAQHLAVRFIAWKHGAEAAARVQRRHLAGSYQLYRLGGGADGPADRPTREFEGPGAYAALVYGKAPYLHDRASALVGERAFLASLRAYLEAYRYRWACGGCFGALLERQNPRHAEALRALRQRWWSEAHGDADLGRGSPALLLENLTGMQVDPEAMRLIEQMLGSRFGP